MYTVLYFLLVSWLVWTLSTSTKKVLVAVTKDTPIITLCMLTYNAQGYKKYDFKQETARIEHSVAKR